MWPYSCKLRAYQFTLKTNTSLLFPAKIQSRISFRWYVSLAASRSVVIFKEVETFPDLNTIQRPQNVLIIIRAALTSKQRGENKLQWQKYPQKLIARWWIFVKILHIIAIPSAHQKYQFTFPAARSFPQANNLRNGEVSLSSFAYKTI